MARLIALIAAIVATMAIDRIAMASDGLDPPFAAPSPWMKFCLKTQDIEAKTICHTGAEVWNRVDDKVVASVEMIEIQGEGKSTLRATFPLGAQLVYGTRLIVDDKVL